MLIQMENIENLCIFHHYIEGFLATFTTHYLVEGEEAGKILDYFKEGRELLEKFLPIVEENSKGFDIEVNEETVPYSYPTSDEEVTLIELHVGTPANEFNQSYAIDFISNILEKQMGFKLSEPSFFVFYLPELPAIITNKGIKGIGTGGFYNINRKRIELNIHSRLSIPEVYENMVHETFHHVLLSNATMIHNEIMVDTFVDSYFDISEKAFGSNEPRILGSIENIILEKKGVLQKLDSALNEIVDMGKFLTMTEKCKAYQHLISEGKLKFKIISGKELDNLTIQEKKKHLL